MSMQDTMTNKVLPLATKLSANKFLISVRDGMMVAFPATMFASIMIIVQNLPTTFSFAQYVPKGVMDFLTNFLGPISNATMNITSLFVAFGIAYHLAGKLHANQLYAGGISLAAFAMLLPIMTNKVSSYIDINYLGSRGMFVAIITAIISTEIFAALENANITIKMPESVPPAIATSFIAILPGSAALLTFTTIRYIFTFTQWGNAFDFIYEILQTPLQGIGSTLPATLVVAFFSQFLWWFGIHGTLVVNSVVQPIYDALALQNYKAYSAGQPIPHIICTTFMGVFEITGMILGFALAMGWVFAKSARMKKTMRMVAVPAFFNISEPVTFGLPMVLNPTIFIPWVLGPMVMVTIGYFAMAVGLVPKPIGATVVWSTPIFLSGWIAVGSWRGAALQLVQVVASTLLWIPFLRVLDKQFLNDEAAGEKKLEKEAAKGEAAAQAAK
ncbi:MULTISPECIES: PTS sugar transporter subunit IIC [Lacticaseibacillus]|uniref:Permease IIC component n=1 Tax=Lacticaseibacillus hegangensis TaxID=2486010 RepID=A0ABW4CVC7_9LACO|nr:MULTISPECIES: PTS transporter subunit EIIC [Lacticaseibacillus]